MNDKTRRRFLIAATGLTTTLSGCSGFIESDQAEAPDVDTAEPTPTSTAETEQPTESAENNQSDPSASAVSIEQVSSGELRVVNGSSAMIPMATVFTEIDSEEGDYREPEDVPLFEIPAGGQQEFEGYNASDSAFSNLYFENKGYLATEDADVTSAPMGITKLQNPTDSDSTAADLNYQIPNRTNIANEDIREATLSGEAYRLERYGDDGKELEVTDEGIVLSTAYAYPWTSVSEVTVSSVSSSETFTWRASSAPDIDISVSGTLNDFDVTVTAQSQTPVLNAVIYAVAIGPSVSGIPNATTMTYRSEARVSDDPTTTALVAESVSESHVGTSRTVNLDYPEISPDFPLEDADKFVVGVASEEEGNGYPVTSTEIPLSDLFE
ncbi:hypothetical protein [Haloarchaeobius sp. FL176]|uniref:hypothetical protein n=1 Tax=Haloarchaeobius sp. FL176 TaxID=2967129 RepID=UPI00214791A2|nr:hypothetical protein [Haloarchaeobius sp. FL176]